VLKDGDLAVRAGESHPLAGDNGAGKVKPGLYE
jgi:ABC-type sugar transport system ATPase subunit